MAVLYVIATDIASRGIDIEFLPFVINYELPRSPKDFVHRIGRTGRAENPGTAFTFVTDDAQHHFKIIQKKFVFIRVVNGNILNYRIDSKIYNIIISTVINKKSAQNKFTNNDLNFNQIWIIS